MNRAMRIFALPLAAMFLTTAAAFAQEQQDQQSGPTGTARVVQRQGPQIDVERQQRPVAAVVFTQPGESLEVTILETSAEDPNNDREALFESRNAQKGVVTHDFGQGGRERRLVITARRNGEPVQVEQIGSSGQAHMFCIRREQPKQEQNNMAQVQQQQEQQAAQQQEQQAAQQQGQQNPPAEAQPAAAQQQPPQPQQQEKQTPEQNDAVIFLYMIGQRQ